MGEDTVLDAILAGRDVPVLVQGATGRAARRHIALMRAAGTRIVAGIAPGASVEAVDGVPLFADCAAAVASTGARASIVMVPPLRVLAAVREAVEAGLGLVVAVAEGMPVHDALKAARLARERGVVWIGPSTPGLAVPGRLKLGFLPDAALAPGPLGVVSKSGTLSYEIGRRLARRGIGQSAWIGVGGDPVKGTRFADLVALFSRHAGTRGLLVVGEIGGSEEEELAGALRAARFSKPVFVVLAGASAPEGVTMGHAGALVHGRAGGLEAKTEALRSAGARVFVRMEDAVDDIAASLGAETVPSHEQGDTG